MKQRLVSIGIRRYTCLCMLPVAMALSYPDGIMFSSFVDDDTFSRNGLYGLLCVFLCGKYITAKTSASFSTKFCSTIKNSKYTSGLCIRGKNYYL